MSNQDGFSGTAEQRAERAVQGNRVVDLTTNQKGAGAGTTTDTASNDLKGDTARLEPGNDSVRMSLTPEHGLDDGVAGLVMKKRKAANGLRTQPGPIPSSLKSQRPLTALLYAKQMVCTMPNRSNLPRP